MVDNHQRLAVATNHWKQMTRLAVLLPEEFRMLKMVALMEKVLQELYPVEKTEGEQAVSLEKLLKSRQAFVDSNLYSKVHKARMLRNQCSHDGSLSTDQKGLTAKNIEAAKAAEHFIRVHLESIFLLHGTDPPAQTASDEIRESRFKYKIGAPRSVKPDAQTPRPPRPRDRSHLNAVDVSPWVSASAIAEHYFCPRAGIISHSRRAETPPTKTPSLYLLPVYQIDRLKQDRLDALLYTAACWIALVLILVGSLVFRQFFVVDKMWFLLTLAGISVIAAWLMQTATSLFFRFLDLTNRIGLFEQAPESVPDPQSTKMQAVDWWGILKSGFEVSHPNQSLRYDPWRLTGKPDRILTKGGLKIPVFEMELRNGELAAPQRKHIAKAVAYCNLLALRTGADSPYAIVLGKRQYAGFTVSALLEENQKCFEDGLVRLRKTLLSSTEPPEPQDQRCKRRI